MTTELTRYNGHRYVLYKAQNFTDNTAKAVAGRTMQMGAYIHL
jgi:hypothetical protein